MPVPNDATSMSVQVSHSNFATNVLSFSFENSAFTVAGRVAPLTLVGTCGGTWLFGAKPSLQGACTSYQYCTSDRPLYNDNPQQSSFRHDYVNFMVTNEVLKRGDCQFSFPNAAIPKCAAATEFKCELSQVHQRGTCV